MSLAISLRSETLKLKRTLGVYLCIGAAVFGPFMSFLENINPASKAGNALPWTEHFLEGREPLCIALLPLYVILFCTLLLQIEYRDKTWKQVLSSPQELNTIFTAKFLTLQAMIVAFILVYNFCFVITAFATELIRPTIYDGGVDIYRIVLANAQAYVLIFGVSAIQFFLSLRIKNFIGPLAIGIGLWFLAPMLIFEFKLDGAEYYPYALTIASVMSKYEGNVVAYQWCSIGTAVVFLTLALITFRRKTVKA